MRLNSIFAHLNVWVLLPLLVLYISNAVNATHFAYGTHRWYKPEPIISPNTVIIRANYAFRWSYPAFSPEGGGSWLSSPAVGRVISLQNMPATFKIKGPGYEKTIALNTFVVAYVQEADDWLNGYIDIEWTAPNGNDVDYVAVYEGQNRLSSLQDNNRDVMWKIQCNINVADGRVRGPITTGSNRIYAEKGILLDFNLPYSQGDGGCNGGCKMQFSFPPKSYSNLNTVNPSGMTLDQRTGRVQWTPQRNGLYSVQFLFEEIIQDPILKPGDQSITPLYVVLDTVVEVVNACVVGQSCNQAPHFSPPTVELYSRDRCNNQDAALQARGYCGFYRSITKVLEINAVDYNTDQTVTVDYTLLPSGAEVKRTEFGLLKDDPYETNTSYKRKAWSTYTFTWTPSIEAVETPVCFVARDSLGKKSYVQYCLTMSLVNAKTIYLSGIIRDFDENNPRFNYPSTSKLDVGAGFIENTLGFDGKPTYKVGNWQSVDQASFQTWYNPSSASKSTVFSITLIQLDDTKNVFTFDQSVFTPISGKLYGDVGDENTGFTYELHTYIRYEAGAVYNFASSDDLWIFIDGKLPPNWGLAGVHSIKEGSINMDTLAGLWGLQTEVEYRLDIFFASRSKNKVPSLKLQLPETLLCDAISGSGIQEYEFKDRQFKAGTDIVSIADAGYSNGELYMITTDQQSAALWSADGTKKSNKVKVMQGFETSFTFKVGTTETSDGSSKGTSEGFAFVMQADDGEIQGSGGVQLGYGGLKNAIAVEFDFVYDGNMNDPNYQHVAIQIGSPGQSLSSVHSDGVTGGITSYDPLNPDGLGNAPLFTFDNGTAHTVRIQYVPSRDDANSVKVGFIRVWINEVLRPVVEASVDGTMLRQMFSDGAAYIGFTAGSSRTRKDTITISKWGYKVVPPSAADTDFTVEPQNSVAGVPKTAVVQARDACGNAIGVGEEPSVLTVKYLETATQRELINGVEATTSIKSNNDGTYDVQYTITKATDVAVFVYYKGDDIKGSGKQISVSPGPADFRKSELTVASLPVAENSADKANALFLMYYDPSASLLSASLAFNTQSCTTAACASTFLDTHKNHVVMFVVTGSFSLSDDVKSVLTSQWGATELASARLTGLNSYAYIRDPTRNLVNQSYVEKGSTPEISLSSASGKYKMVARSNAPERAGYLNLVHLETEYPAGPEQRSVFITMRDEFGNLQTDGGQNLASSFTTSTLGGYDQTSIVQTSPGYYSLKVNSTKQGEFTLTVRLNRESIVNSPKTLVFTAGKAVASKSYISGSGVKNARAGDPTEVRIALVDIYGNIADTETGMLQNTVTASLSSTNVPMEWDAIDRQSNLKYSLTEAKTYTWIITINGEPLVFETQGNILTVTAGDLSPAHCTVGSTIEEARTGTTAGLGVRAIGDARAGVLKTFYVQARDRYGNVRNDENFSNQAFVVVYSGKAIEVGSDSIIYERGSPHKVQFISEEAPGDVFVKITSDNNVVSAVDTYTIAVSVGPASKLSEFSTSSATTATAGQKTIFTIKCKDSKGNAIQNCPANSFTFAATLYGSPLGAFANNASAGDSVSVEFTATKAASTPYILTVTPADPSMKLSGPVANTPHNLNILPAATEPSQCKPLIYPPGYGPGGKAQAPSKFQVQARDAFGNIQIDTVSDVVTAEIGGSSENVVITPKDGGIYEVEYTVPGGETFEIKYYVNGVLVETVEGTSVSNDDECFITWGKGDLLYVNAAADILAGDETTKILLPAVATNNGELDDITGETFFRISFSGPASYTATSTTAGQRAYVTMPKPTLQGVYSMTVLKLGVIPCIQQKTFNAADKTDSPFQLTVTPAAANKDQSFYTNLPSTSSVTADTGSSFNVTLRDEFGNLIEDKNAQYTVRAEFSPTNENFIATLSGSTYSINYMVRSAGTHIVKVVFEVNGQATQIRNNEQVIIEPGAPNLPKSVVTLLTTNPVTAGKNVEYKITFKDTYDNPVTNLISSADSGCMAGNTDKAQYCLEIIGMDKATIKAIGGIAGSTSEFRASKMEKAAGTRTVSFKLNVNGVIASELISGQEVSYEVKAAAVNGKASYVTNQYPTSAGAPITFNFFARDEFNNPIKSNPGLMYVVIPNAGQVQAQYDSNVDSSVNGQYGIVLAGDFTRKVSDKYEWSFRTAGFQQTVAITADADSVSSITDAAPLQSSTVVPGDVVAANSKLPAKGIPDTVAKSELKFSVELADEFGNVITDPTQLSTSMKNIDLRFVSSNTTTLDVISYSVAECGAEDDGDADSKLAPSYNFTNLFLPIEQSVVEGKVVYTCTPVSAGNFRVILAHKTDSTDVLPCVTSQIVQVLPGEVHPPSSKLISLSSGEPINLLNEKVTVTAGSNAEIGVRLYDEASNLVTGECVHSSSLALATTGTNALNPSKWSVSNCINAYRMYMIDFTPTKVGTYNFIVNYATKNGVIGGKEDGTQVEVVPGELTQFTITHNDAPRAGYPHTFRIAATDEYDNPATATSPVTYKVSIQLRNTDPYSVLRIPVLYEPVFQITSGGMADVTFTSTVEGKFTINVTMAVGGADKFSSETYLTLEPMQCVGAAPYRCEDSTCVASYKECPKANMNSCNADGATSTCVQCQNGEFKNSLTDCACPVGQTRCAAGNCAPECFPTEGTPSCTVVCWDGSCRDDQKNCPSKPVCNPGYSICNDGRTCVPSDKVDSLCPPAPTTSTCRTGFFLCPTGDCKASYTDCSTLKTCSNSADVLCADGSCKASQSLCSTPAPCPVDRAFICPDGSCSPTLDVCPSSVACNPGNVRCEDGSCASSVTECKAPSTCAGIRCPDGSCGTNTFYCPTPPTCPSDYVLCSDGACVEFASWCAKDTQCPSGSTFCSDGSCASGESLCPTVVQCPKDFPVRCASDGACKKTREECCDLSKGATCGQSFSCSASRPFRCSDGTCVTDLLDCPSGITCPELRSIKCPDGTCVASPDACMSPTISQCPAGRVRCKTGECVTSTAFCPVHTTCPTDFTRCEDGVCRTRCEAMVPNVGCPDDNPVQCPISTQGQICVKSMLYCPSAPVCDGVRCFDGSCVAELLQCPPPATVGKEPNADRKPCPDGTFVTAAGSDPSLDYCPPISTCSNPNDFKCGDGSCTSVLSDCERLEVCPPDSQGNPQYHCGSGVCAKDPNSATCNPSSTTSTTGGLCKPSEYLCPTGECVADWINDCPKKSTETISIGDCPVSQYRCADKTCRAVCPSYENIFCSVYLPFSCPDGLCAKSEAECNHPETGCPYHSPVRCWTTGECVKEVSKCPKESNCAAGEQYCFGFCFPSGSEKCASIESNQCSVDKPYRCFDNHCVKDVKECTDNTYSIATTNRNVCPLSNPFRCSNGFCAKSSTSCPRIDSKICTSEDGERQIACADGRCVASSDLCSIVAPCSQENSEQRCPDGSCRTQTFIDAYGCPTTSHCASRESMCANGLCSVNGACLNEVGCPGNEIKCSDGTCVISATSCTELSSHNGCADATPIKCQNGACVKQPADCAAESGGKPVAEVGNGCDSSTPVRCVDGSCKALEIECLPTVLCEPLERLCADFSCVLDSRQCSAVSAKACAPNEYKCNDLSCKASKEECADTCPPTAPILCPTRECVSSISRCQGVVRQNLVTAETCDYTDASSSSIACDSSFLVLTSQATQVDCEAKCSLNKNCQAYTVDLDNTCLLYARACKGVEVLVNRKKVEPTCGGAVGETNEQDAYTLTADGCSDDKPFKCFDQSCATTMAECIAKRAPTSSTGSSTSVDTKLEKAVCGEGFVLCFDGSCASQNKSERKGANCPIIPRCPAKQYRCLDGSCSASSTGSCTVSSDFCPSGLRRCEDGVCRDKCMQFDGCPLSAPFHCFERTCATSAGACNSALNASPDGYGISTARRRLLASPTDIGEEKPIPCHTNCNADEKALPLQLFLDADTASTIPIATKNGKGVEISWLKFPSGSLVMDANSTGPQFSIRAVSDSLMREAENAIHVSRQSEFGGREGLTLPETVLSSAFECITEAQTPFPVEVVHRALLDYTRQPNNRDICLAYLYRIPALNYARWECLSSNPKQSENNPALVEAGITDCGAAGEGKVYAFIHSPAQGPAEAAVDTRSWIQKNLLYIVLGFTITLVFMLVILYAIARLKRYRKKFHKERDDVRKMEEEVMDMEMYGGGVHQRHESLVLTANPMQMQIADLQKRLDKNEIEMLEAENKQRLALSKERQKQISNLQADRERLAKELESARAALEGATVQPVVFRVSTSGPSGGTTSSPNATGGEGGGGGEGGVPSATRARTKERKAFGAAKPQGKKKKSLN